jgi:hypothetical protein
MIAIETVSIWLGRQATPDEMTEIHRIQAAQKLHNSDPFLSIYATLRAHSSMFDAAPAKLNASMQEFATHATKTAESEIAKLAAQTTNEIAKAVSIASLKVAKDVAGASRWRWMLSAAVGLTLCMVFIGYTAFIAGKTAGAQAGLMEARDEKAAAAWANTPEGKYAKVLMESPTLDALRNCSRAGWYVKDGVCYAAITPQGDLYGWKLP